MRVFGGWSRIEGYPGQLLTYGATKPRDLARRRQAIPEIDRGLRYEERFSGQCGQFSGIDLALTRSATADLNRIVRLEDEGAWYCGHRKVEGDVEEDGQKHSATTVHGGIVPDAAPIAQGLVRAWVRWPAL